MKASSRDPLISDNTEAHVVNSLSFPPNRGNGGRLDIGTDLSVGDGVGLRLGQGGSCDGGDLRCNGVRLSLLDCQSL